MKNYNFLVSAICVLLISNTLVAQNKVPTLAKPKAQTAMLVKRDTTHKKLAPSNPVAPRIVAQLVTLSKTGQIIPVSPNNSTTQTGQTKVLAQPLVQAKNISAKSVPPSVNQPQNLQPKPVQQVAQAKIVQPKPNQQVAQVKIVQPKPNQQVTQTKTVQPKPNQQVAQAKIVQPKPIQQVVQTKIVQPKPVQQVVQTKIVQPKPVQQVAQTKIVQPKPVQQIAQAKIVTAKSVPQQIVQTQTRQINAAPQKTTLPKISPNNMLLASIVAPKSKAVPVAKNTKNASRRASPETEFRGVWVSTVQQVDFPTKESVDPSVLQADWLRLLRFYKSLNLNAVIVQVRPTADAIYPSKLVPYSKWLTGQSGKPLAGNFDMLKFMIETSHAEGMEFHAWINPYRVLMDNDTLHLAPNHIFKTHRNWVLKYGKEHHLNPGLPEVWKHITAVTEEIVVNYAIDAVHFDDYFYPYRIDGENLKDGEAFKKYGKKFKNIDDWRRSNTDSMFFNVRQVIKKHKPYVQLGVSPFAVWRNKTDSADTKLNPGLIEGSDTHAFQSCYADLYADVVTWMRRGWLDYVAPEVYFHKNHPLVGYENAVDWWLKNSFGTPVYISHAIYKVNNKEKYPEWRDPQEIPRQLDLVRTKQNVKGLVFFSSRWLLENQLGVTDSIRNNFFYQPTKLPKP